MTIKLISRFILVIYCAVGYHRTQSKMASDDCSDPIAAPDVPMATLQMSLSAAKTEEKKTAIRSEMADIKQRHERIDNTMRRIVEAALRGTNKNPDNIFTAQRTLTNHDTYQEAVERLGESGIKVFGDAYALSKLQILLNLCEEDGMSKETILAAIDKAAPLH